MRSFLLVSTNLSLPSHFFQRSIPPYSDHLLAIYIFALFNFLFFSIPYSPPISTWSPSPDLVNTVSLQPPRLHLVHFPACSGIFSRYPSSLTVENKNRRFGWVFGSCAKSAQREIDWPGDIELWRPAAVSVLAALGDVDAGWRRSARNSAEKPIFFVWHCIPAWKSNTK